MAKKKVKNKWNLNLIMDLIWKTKIILTKWC
jgi:hypothetical protein